MNSLFYTIETLREDELRRDLHIFDGITHRVLDDYTEAVAELRLAAASECGPSGLVLRSAAARLLVRAGAHRALQAPKAGGKMELSGYLERVCAAVSAARLAERGDWLSLAADDVWLDADRCWLVGLIIADLVDAAACPGLSGGPAAVSVKIFDGGWRMVGSVSNPGGVSSREGRGRRLVEALSTELGGTVEWASARHGSCAWFEFPIERPARTPLI
jgi:two-component sensor histidine kinase